VGDRAISMSTSFSLVVVLMGWTINQVMFGMCHVTLLDPALRSHVFDESEWKKITAGGARRPLKKVV
jgi:hypothetical protein